MADPLGISTGQGKGRAQVFGNTYNDYFAEKVKTGTEEKKTQQAELAKLQAADGLWDRDNELFKPKIEALRKYYRENARNIIKGDFDATTNLQAMKDDLTQFIGSSKASKEFFVDLKKKIVDNPNDYSDATKARMDEYQRTGGRFDNDISFFSKYKASDTIDSLSDKVKSAGYDLDNITYGTDPSGKTYMIDKSGQKVDIDKMVDSVISAEDSFYGDNQVSEYWNQPGKKDQLKETLTSLMGEKRSTKYSPIKGDNGAGEASAVFEFSSVPKTSSTNVPYGLDQEEGTIGYSAEDVSVINQVPFETGISFKSSPSSAAIPLTGDFIREVIDKETGESKTIGGEVKSGAKFNVSDVKKGYQGSWTIMNSAIMPTFPKGYKAQNGQDIGGFLIGESSRKSKSYLKQFPDGNPEMRYYVTMSNDRGDEVLEPFINVLPAIKQQYKSKGDTKSWNDFYNKTKNYLKEQGYSQAYKDFTGKDLPKNSGTKVVVEEVSLTPEQIKSVREANPDATKDMSDDEILESYKSQ